MSRVGGSRVFEDEGVTLETTPLWEKILKIIGVLV